MPKLYVVGTPIGNLGDVSQRALEVLGSVGFIAAEDTRVTRQLLAHFGIQTPLVSNHRHNEEEKSASLVDRMLENDEDAALVTDAGTPAISDPGSFLVDEALQRGLEVLAVPGPTAMASALSVSGFDTREFAFYGFLPRKTGDLRKKLLEIAESPVRIAVLHESPHRVIDLVECIAETLPGARISASCDLTKKFEKTIRGAAEEVLSLLRENEKAEKGEYCLVLDLHNVHIEKTATSEQSLEEQILTLMLQGTGLREASERVMGRGARRNEVYRAREAVHRFLDTWDD